MKATVPLAALIIAVAVILLLFALVNSLLAKEQENAPKRACRLSLFLLAKADEPITGTKITVPHCPRRKTTFEKEPIQKIQRKIADEIVSCLKTSGEGKWDWAGSPIIQVQNPVNCLICGMYNFTGKTAAMPPIDVSNYLASKRMSVGKQLYTEYFEIIERESPAIITYVDELSPEKEYVLFTWGYNTLYAEKLIKKTFLDFVPREGIFFQMITAKGAFRDRGVGLHEPEFVEQFCTNVLN